MINPCKSRIIKRDKKRKNDKRCEDEYSSCILGTDLICDQCDSGTDRHPVSEKTQDGTDGACRRCTVTFEEGRYSDHGRCDLPDRSRSDDPVLCKGLSERDSGTVSDTGIWYHRFSG